MDGTTMQTIASQYALFEVSQTCSDAQLKTAYRQQLLKHHPDLNSEDVAAATARTQQLNATYAALKEHRQQQKSRMGASQPWQAAQHRARPGGCGKR
jgi:DnaJ-class molecular chaperone